MDYEQKYKEALNKAQKELQCCGTLNCGAARQIFRFFPELKESEDERISREITEFLVDFNNGGYERPDENTIDSWLSWLEKQGEEKYSVWVGGIEVNDYYITKKESNKIAEKYKEEGYNDVVIEKQGGHKPFDYENANIPQKDFAPKAEPKFKVDKTTENKEKNMESNLSKYLKSNHDVLDKVVDDITEWMQCDDCPAKKLCNTIPTYENKECADIFKEWSLKEE